MYSQASAVDEPPLQQAQRERDPLSASDELWMLYNATPCMEEGDPREVVTIALQKFFFDHHNTFLDAAEVRKFGRVSLDFSVLKADIPVAEFASVLKDEPQTVLACLSLSVHQALVKLRIPLPGNKIVVRLTNYAPITAVRNLKSNFVDKYVSLRGNVVRASNIKPLVTGMYFDCTKCDLRTFRAFTDGKYNPPTACEGKCKSKTFAPDRQMANTIDWQRIRIQEIVSNEQADQARIPRTIDCELTGDLVDCCIPGDVVTVSGVVKARKTDVYSKGSKAKNKSLFVLYLDVNNVEIGKKDESGKLDVLQLTQRDHEAIVDIVQQENLFKFVVHSLCPAIYGHEVVKAGLLLSLFGGCPRKSGEKNKIAVRSDAHVLVVGDPGLGKSQMLRAVQKVAPRGVYVCGNTTTTSGLTVTMVRDGKGGDHSLEAGALVLGDQGICCIDEFDKMGNEHNSLLEAMEQQSISIAKAGIVCTLAARTSVLAAANPVGGHYNRSKTVAENLKIGTPLLSRFDLIFILLDRPDEDRDQLLSEHVIALHSGHGRAKAIAAPGGGGGGGSGTGSGSGGAADIGLALSQRSSASRGDKDAKIRSSLGVSPGPSGRSRGVGLGLGLGGQGGGAGGDGLGSQAEWAAQHKSLAERLRMTVDDLKDFDPLPAQLLRKYIAYAKKYVKPKLSLGAKKVLESFYLSLRKDHQSPDGTPITTRQLESMIRLAEARAKAELREVVTEQDAIDVVDVMKESLYDVMADELGHVDFKRSKGISKAKQTSAFMKQLHRLSEQRQNAVFTFQELHDVAKQMHLGVDNFESFVDVLNQSNFLLSKGGRKYQVQSRS